MTTQKVFQETGIACANAPAVHSTSPASSSSPKKAAPPSTVSISASEKAHPEEATAADKKKMNNGYYEGMQPEQNAGTNPNNNSNGEYATTATNSNVASATDPFTGGSVVNDLAKVYENLTQSSTPQVPPAAPSSKYHIPPPMFHVPPSATLANQGKPLHSNQHGSSAAAAQEHPHHHDPSRQASAKQEDSVPSSIPSSINMSGSGSTLLHNEESDDHSSSKRKRRGSHSSAQKGKKKSKQDGRWSKRFTWPEDLHRDFVSAIFDVGLKQSSPSTILEQMPKHEQITTERIKSHLQKYRLHRAKSKKEFISTYEASLRKLQSQGGVSGINTLAGGEVAAHLTYSHSIDSGGKATSPSAAATASGSSMDASVQMSRPTSATNAAVQVPQEEHETLMLPELTEAEKQSPIGSAMGYLMGLFFSLRQQLLIQRSLENARGVAAPTSGGGGEVHMQDIYGTFAAGSTAGPAQTMAAPDLPSEPLSHQQSIPSMRTNIEENSIMKREMQNQMALQNKMRALKEQELAKYKNNDQGDVGKMPTAHYHIGSNQDAYASKNAGTHMNADQGMSHGQGAGEMGGNEVSDATNQHRPHGLSFGTSADLWNSDVVDDQLFEFLMND